MNDYQFSGLKFENHSILWLPAAESKVKNSQDCI